jgi:hypothetical protein
MQRSRRFGKLGVGCTVAAFLVVCAAQGAEAQSREPKDYFSVGVFGGVAHYAGDLSPGNGPSFPADQLTGLARVGASLGVFGSYHWHPHMSVRAYLGYGKVSADDAESKSEVNRVRNLSFQSNLYEASVQLHYDYFGNDRDYRFRPRVTPFIFTGVGLVAFNPQAYRDPRAKTGLTELAPLRTEAQSQAYSTVALVIPFGGGVRFRLSDRYDLRVEVGLRWTASDFLDDVSGSSAGRNQGHPLPSQLTVSADQRFFSYRATAPTADYSLRRGNPARTDWYAFTGISIARILDNPVNCPKPRRRPLRF